MPRLECAEGRRVFAGMILAAVLSGCGSVARAPEENIALVQGPTRWLMLPEEEQRARHLRGVPDVLAFEEAFWKRRNPASGSATNPLLQEFNLRVDAADRLYQEGPLRGSLTDRGRALVILGAPPILRYGQRQIPTWEPGHSGGEPSVESRTVQIETWVYPLVELPPFLSAAFQREGYDDSIEISFAAEPERTHLTAGERILQIAVRATAHE